MMSFSLRVYYFWKIISQECMQKQKMHCLVYDLSVIAVKCWKSQNCVLPSFKGESNHIQTATEEGGLENIEY